MSVIRPIWYDAVKADLNDDLTYYSMPPPGSGVLAAFVLNILDEYRSADYKGVNPADSSDPLVYHRMSEAFKHAYAQRTKLGDPQFDPQLNQVLYCGCYNFDFCWGGQVSELCFLFYISQS